MIRKLFLPLVAVALLGGCVTSGYGYRAGNGGDYYYGGPSVEYRYYSPYGSYYGGSYGYYGQGYGYGYGGYGYGYGYPYYQPYYYDNRIYYYGQPRVDPVQPPPVDPPAEDGLARWQDLERLRTRVRGDRVPVHVNAPSSTMAEPGVSARRNVQIHQRRPAPAGSYMQMPQPRARVSAPQTRSFPVPQPRSAPAPRAEGSVLGGTRRVRKGDIDNETAP